MWSTPLILVPISWHLSQFTHLLLLFSLINSYYHSSFFRFTNNNLTTSWSSLQPLVHKHPTFQTTIQDPSVFIFTPSSAPATTIIDQCGIRQEPIHSQFSIPFQQSESLYCVWPVWNNEILSCYGFQSNLTASELALDQLLLFSMPASLSLAIVQHLDSTESFLNTLPFTSSDIINILNTQVDRSICFWSFNQYNHRRPL